MSKPKWLLNRLGAMLLFALCAGGVYFYQLGILFAPKWLQRGQATPMTKSALEAAMHAFDPQLALITAGLAIVQIGVLYALYRWQLRRRNPLNIHRRPFRLESLFFLIAMYALVLGVNLIFAGQGTPENQQAVLHEMSILPVTLFIMAGIAGPIIEEFTFRGVFMNLFWMRDTPFSNIAAVVSSGVIFGLLHEPHLSPFLLLYSSLGIILAFTYRYHRDLRYSLILHIGINFLPALAGLFRGLVA